MTVKFITGLGALLLVWPCSSWATTGLRVVDARALNLREAPSAAGPKLDSLPRGTVVEVLEEAEDSSWNKIETAEGKVGWVASKYLRAARPGENSSLGQNDDSPVITSFAPSSHTNENLRSVVVTTPAPRGRILDREGEALALNAVVDQVVLTGYEGPFETAEEFALAVEEDIQRLEPLLGRWMNEPGPKRIREHFEHRRELPLSVSRPGVPGKVIERLQSADLSRAVTRKVHLRTYPFRNLAAHIVGYLAREAPDPSGPVRQEEPLWPVMKGVSGIESQFNEDLSGTDGVMALGYKQGGEEAGRDILKNPEPGNDVVLTLDIRMQKAVEEALKSHDKAGAAVVLNAYSGDILAMASVPAFDPSLFAASIRSSDYEGLKNDPEAPLFPRAWASTYPPGSIFKPVVALAALESGGISVSTQFYCPPQMEIDGRIFRNWSETEHGVFGLRSALARSHNSFFYQAGHRAGPSAILNVAHQFGFGQAPPIFTKGVAPGALPGSVVGSQALANLSIGQGDLLVSPLQATLMMASLCNAGVRPSARLVQQIQSNNGRVLRHFQQDRRTRLSLSDHHLASVRSGLYAVVNHEHGTGKSAYQPSVPVFGKTGTAQWSKEKKEASVAWFAGFIPGSSPPLAFTVLLEGDPGEQIFGGRTAAPVAGQFLETFFRNPEDYGIELPQRLLSTKKQDDRLILPLPPKPLSSRDGRSRPRFWLRR